MIFETNIDVLNWYENQPSTLTKEFVENINWKDVKNYPLDKKFVPILLYMRDVETLTDVYYEELRRTPTGKDPIISKFMERWKYEEEIHGEILNRFLNEYGIETEQKWQENVRTSVTTSYTVINYLISVLASLVGRRFTATHMAFGAIHEMSTMQGYRRLKKLANHPVLSQILTGIVREESTHATFYRGIARIELKQSGISRKLARFILQNFYQPVGTSAMPIEESKYAIGTLFEGDEGMKWIDRNVTFRVQKLPGLEGLTTVSEKIGKFAWESNSISGQQVTRGLIG
jgi:rubrerythrin